MGDEGGILRWAGVATRVPPVETRLLSTPCLAQWYVPAREHVPRGRVRSLTPHKKTKQQSMTFSTGLLFEHGTGLPAYFYRSAPERARRG